MGPAVFVLGTSHPLQCGVAECGADRIDLLDQEIRRALSEHGIRRIVEEMSEDGLRERLGEEAAQETVCQRVARDSIPVQFVDLGRKERACLSLSDDNIGCFVFENVEDHSEQERVRESFHDLCGDVRERVWVARVLSCGEWPVLFVCGADHVDSVGRLFERVGVQVTVICRDFDPQRAS